MLLHYRDRNFWKNFHAGHWQPSVPTVLRQPFQNFPFSEELLLQSLKAFAAGLEDGDQRKHCLVSVGGKEIAPRRPLKKLFQEGSESLEQLEQACSRVFEEKPFGLMVTQMHTTHPGIWNALTSFLQDARRSIDPAPRAFVDLFYGNYSSTFTGLHKDTQEIIAFVIRGKKRMLAWPFEYFLPKVKGLTRADKYQNKRLSIDHSPYRKDALVLDAEPGDVIYWPSSYWHVSEVLDGNFSAMLSMGLVRPDLVLSPSSSAKPLVSREIPAALPPTDASQQMRWMTSFGFELGGPVAEKVEPIPKKTIVVKSASSVIVWKKNVAQKRLVVAANGQSIAMPDSPKVRKLLVQLATGEPIPFTPPRDREERSTFAETQWDRRCVLTTRKLTSRRDPAVHLVDWLLRVHALERV